MPTYEQPLTLDPSTGEYSAQLDMAYVEDRDAEVAEYAAKFGVGFELVNESGSGGGWPIYKFTGTAEALLTMLAEYHDDPDLKRQWYAAQNQG
ncbi:hypothetical protein ACFVU2_21325 [Leifsonia sp. NPDC058194]|uniref:hypothetical protein n=1 Tax=Leifsonia sp. NPDC058194 TaxID=3346374 RepID=UPI0036DF9494